MSDQLPVTSNQRILMSGNEAIAEAAIEAGCRFYAGYPITPQNEIPTYMSKRMPEAGGIFIQAESELAAINMVFGAAAAGVRAMTSSSGPGISLKQEGISYMAGARLPAVIVNVMRGGPGLGNIAPSQSDYFQATKGGGHGDYHCIVLAPSTVSEARELTISAFDLADKYRIPVIILADGMLGQMMEGIEYKHSAPKIKHYKKPWALTGAKDRKQNIVRSFYLREGRLEEINQLLQAAYQEISKKEQLAEVFFLDEAEIILVAYGSMSRIAKQAMFVLRSQGIKAGLIRPITLWPFPETQIIERTCLPARQGLRRKKITPVFFVVEMSYGQMLEDVKLAVSGKAVVNFYGRAGGGIPTEGEIIEKITKIQETITKQ